MRKRKDFDITFGHELDFRRVFYCFNELIREIRGQLSSFAFRCISEKKYYILAGIP